MWKFLKSSLAVASLVLALCTTTGAITSEGTINPIPTPAGTNWLDQLETFLNQEDADRFALIHDDFVVSGGVISTGAGLTKTPTSLTAFIKGFYTTESGNITFPDDDTCWVIASKDLTGDIATFTRVAGTHYLTDCVSVSPPALPADTIWISQVTTAGGSVTEVIDLRTTSSGSGLGVRAGITASTTQTQGQQPLVCNVIAQVSTVANDDDTITLPAASAGCVVYLFHDGANNLQVFPASADNLGQGANTALSFAAGTQALFTAYDGTNWKVMGVGRGLRFEVANLPTTQTAGDRATVTNGDAAGASVLSDGTEWHCSEFYASGEMNVACPPWNFDSTAADNSAALDKLCEDSRDVALGNEGVRHWSVPNRNYNFTIQVDCDNGANTIGSVLHIKGLGGRSGFTFNHTGAAGLQFQQSTAINRLSVQNFGFAGGATDQPTNLVICNGCSQTQIINVKISNVKQNGWRFAGGGSHTLINGGGCGNEIAITEVANAACWVFSDHNDLTIMNTNMESEITSPLALVNFSQGIISRAIRLIGNGGHSGGKFVIHSGAGPIHGLSLHGNHYRDLADEPLTLTGAGVIYDLAAHGNTFHSNAGVGNCMSLNGAERPQITATACEGFANGASILNIVGGGILDLTLNGIVTHGFATFTGIKDLSVVARVTGQVGGNVFQVGNATAGNNTLKAFLDDAATQADGLTTDRTGLQVSDQIVLPRKTQVVSCPDTASASVSVVTAIPWGDEIVIDNLDTNGGCRFQPDGDSWFGMEPSFIFGSTVSAQPIKVTNDVGTTCATLTDGDYPVEMKYTGKSGEAYQFAPAVTTASC